MYKLILIFHFVSCLLIEKHHCTSSQGVDRSAIKRVRGIYLEQFFVFNSHRLPTHASIFLQLIFSAGFSNLCGGLQSALYIRGYRDDAVKEGENTACIYLPAYEHLSP